MRRWAIASSYIITSFFYSQFSGTFQWMLFRDFFIYTSKLACNIESVVLFMHCAMSWRISLRSRYHIQDTVYKQRTYPRLLPSSVTWPSFSPLFRAEAFGKHKSYLLISSHGSALNAPLVLWLNELHWRMCNFRDWQQRCRLLFPLFGVENDVIKCTNARNHVTQRRVKFQAEYRNDISKCCRRQHAVRIVNPSDFTWEP